MMNDIISSKTTRLQIKTFSAIQKIKYDLKASNQTSVQKSCHINFLRSLVDQELCSKITSSWKSYEDRLKETRQKKKRHNQKIGVITRKKSLTTRRGSKTQKESFLKIMLRDIHTNV